MPQSRNQVRRRQKGKVATSTKKAQAEPQNTSRESDQAQHLTLKHHVLAIGRYVYIALLGALCAASFSRTDAAILLFSGCVGAMLLSLLLVFMSILRSPDRTPVRLPTVYFKDGTVNRPEAMTVHDHDNKIATYFAAELPALAAATAWFYMWVSFRPIFFCYAIYLAYRISYHPLFRIHLWKEPYQPEFERPFGGVPLFKINDPSSGVKVVEGRAQFRREISAAGDKLVVVDFSATWCAPCRAMAPKFKEMAVELGSQCIFLTVDVDISQDVAEDESISSIPTFVFFKDGERVEMMRGAAPQKLRETIQRHI